MSRSGGKSGKGERSITPEEAELWGRLALSVDKVKSKARVTSHGETGLAPASPKRVAAEPPKPEPKTPATPRPTPPPKEAAPIRPAPLADFDRRAVRQVASGKLAIDARLDLHGVRRREAHGQLRSFLAGCQQKGCRTVLVITGKGDEAANRDHLADAMGEPQRGVLRRLVPQWLAEPDLRSVVLSFTNASARHGGNGALYVQLRRAR